MRNRFQAGSANSEILIYGEIGASFWEDDGGITAKSVKAQLDNMPASSDVVVRINSPGGSAFEGIAIGNILRDSNRRIVVKVDGTAISAASIIAMAGDEIRMANNALMMIHDPSVCVCGDADDMRDMATRLDNIADALAETYVSKTGKSHEDVRSLMADETWMGAQEALDAGFATHIDGANDSAEATLTEWRIAAYHKPPETAKQWMRPAASKPTNVLTVDTAEAMKSLREVTSAAVEAKAAQDAVIQTTVSPPADKERGGINPNTETAMELSEVQAALTDATAKVAQLTEDVSVANSRGDMLEAQNIALVEERDAATAKLDTIDDARLADKVKALIGVKFPSGEYNDQLESAQANEELFDRLMNQRSDMKILVSDPADIGGELPAPRVGANANGQGLTKIVNAATAAKE